MFVCVYQRGSEPSVSVCVRLCSFMSPNICITSALNENSGTGGATICDLPVCIWAAKATPWRVFSTAQDWKSAAASSPRSNDCGSLLDKPFKACNSDSNYHLASGPHISL